MSMESDDANELSWLKGDKKQAEQSGRISPLPAGGVSPRPPAESKDAPSWLYEENDGNSPLSASTKSTQPKTSAAKTATSVKWKTPINRGNDEVDDPDAESETCCCCCPSDPMLFAFQCFHFTAGTVGLTALAANVYAFTRPHITIRDAIIRSYALVFCMLVVIIEIDWRFVVNKIKFVDWWILRGLFYALIGFITFGITDASAQISQAPQEIIGIMIWAIGICYIVMGIFCMKSMKQRRQIVILRRWQRLQGDAGAAADDEIPA